MDVRTPATFVLAAVLALAASASRAAVVHIEVHGIAFVPAVVKARTGDVVEWTNRDFVAHTATARKGEWDVNLPVGKTGRVTLGKPGNIAYYCRLHPNMTGTIEVIAK